VALTILSLMAALYLVGGVSWLYVEARRVRRDAKDD
jgi:uncharacterized membrane protein